MKQKLLVSNKPYPALGYRRLLSFSKQFIAVKFSAPHATHTYTQIYTLPESITNNSKIYYNSKVDTASSSASSNPAVLLVGPANATASLDFTAAAKLVLTKLGPQLTLTCIAALT